MYTSGFSPSHSLPKPDRDVSCTYSCFCSQFSSSLDAASCSQWWGLDEQQRALLGRWNYLGHSCWAVWGCCPSWYWRHRGDQSSPDSWFDTSSHSNFSGQESLLLSPSPTPSQLDPPVAETSTEKPSQQFPKRVSALLFQNFLTSQALNMKV